MPITKFQFVQQYLEGASEPTYHEWKQILEDVDGKAVLDSPPLEVYEIASDVWINCTEEHMIKIEDMCDKYLTTIDHETGIAIPPTVNEILLCAADNADRCFDINVYHPEPDGWMMVRACKDTLCSTWAYTPIPEPGFGLIMVAGAILLSMLGRLNGNRRRRLSRQSTS
jgi:hypothetical protein